MLCMVILNRLRCGAAGEASGGRFFLTTKIRLLLGAECKQIGQARASSGDARLRPKSAFQSTHFRRAARVREAKTARSFQRRIFLVPLHTITELTCARAPLPTA